MCAFKPYSFDAAVKAANSQMTLAAEAFEPWAKAIARTNLETIALSTRRARALMDFGSLVAACRTPEDFAREQALFWQSAIQDSVASVSRIMAAWMLAPSASVSSAWNGQRTAAAEAGAQYPAGASRKDSAPVQTDPPERREAA
jgi:hypothetical protein